MASRERPASLFCRHGRLSKAVCTAAAAALIILAGGATRSDAATLCVNKSGSGGCYSTIQAAIDAVSATDTTILVAPGKYSISTCGGPACSVASILSAASNASDLEGLKLKCRHNQGRSVVLDATGLDHAIYISDVDRVKVQGCVAENAGREGILVEDSDKVTIKENDVRNNDEAMAKTIGQGTPACPTFISPGTPGTSAIQCCPDAYTGGPGNFPEDNDDCGEGIHLRSVTNSVVESNFVHNNIGGILLTDETGPNSGNLVVGNNSSNNRKFGGDCGVTLPSHIACTANSTDASGCTVAPPDTNGVLQAYGVFHNSVVGNVLKHNGASGAGVFTNPGAPPGAATKAYGNLIAENVAKNNGEPGIAIHVHAANGNADNNTIIENIVRGNGGDEEAVPGSPVPGIGIEVLSNGNFPPFDGASPIIGTTISQNKVSREPIDVWAGNTETNANVFLNDLRGPGRTGLQNGGNGTITATDNYWGCPKGPGNGSCSNTVQETGTTGTIISSPFLHHPVSPEK